MKIVSESDCVCVCVVSSVMGEGRDASPVAQIFYFTLCGNVLKLLAIKIVETKTTHFYCNLHCF